MTNQTTIPDEAQASELQASVDSVQRELAAFQKIQAGIAELRKAHPVDLVVDVTTAQGMREAIAGRAAWRDPRVAVEKVRKAAKSPVLDLGRKIDAFAGNLTDELLIGEKNYDDQIKVEERRKESERLAKIAAEEARVQAIKDRIALQFTTVPSRAFGKPAAGIQEKAAAVAGIDLATDEARTIFAELLPEAVRAQLAAMDELHRMHQTALAAEQEAERQRLLAEENARQAQKLADERAVFERQQAAARAEQEELARQAREEKALAEANAERERQARAAELEKIQKAKDELAAAERAEADRLAAVERARLDAEAAERRAAADRQAAQERQAIEEAQRIAEAQRVAEVAKQRKAAAKLAAAQKAGPRLLASLKIMVEIAEQEHPNDDPAIIEARAAIAEAEGDAA